MTRFALFSQSFFPAYSALDDLIQVVVGRAPAQDLSNSRCIGKERRGITGSAWARTDVEFFARHLLHCLQHLLDRISVPIAAVEHLALAPLFQVAQGLNMGIDQVGRVDVVADAPIIMASFGKKATRA